MRSGTCPLCWAPPPVAVQGVLQSLPCRLHSLESLLIWGHPTWPCGQVVITGQTSHASSPGITLWCLASRVEQPGQHSPSCQPSACAAPRTSDIMFILEMDNQGKTSHQRQGLMSQWGQLVCSRVQLRNGAVGQGGRRKSPVARACPPSSPLGDTSLSLSAFGAIRWPVAGTARSAPC